MRLVLPIHPTRVMAPNDYEDKKSGSFFGGTGQKLTHATIIVAGVASLVASLLSILYVSNACHRNEAVLTRAYQTDRYGYKRKSIELIRQSSFDRNHRKNYRKPLLQRYVIRILLMYVSYLVLCFSAEHATKTIQGSYLRHIIMV